MRIYLLLAIILLGVSCTKNQGEQLYNIVYEVDVYAHDSITIEYNSDLFFYSKTYSKIFPLDTNEHSFNIDRSYWTGTRYTNNKEEDYYIKVNFNQYNNPNSYSFGVRIYANDTNLLDSKIFTNNTSEIILQGKVSDKF